MRIVGGVFLAGALSVTLGAQDKLTPEQQIQQLQAQVQAQMNLRGSCIKELAPYLERAGELVTITQVVTTFENANPGKSLGPDLKIIDKPAPKP